MKQHRKRIRSMALVAAFCLLFSSLGFLSSSATASNSIIINGITIPTADYPEGSYYTNNKTACNHAETGETNCKWYTPSGDTGGFGAGIQCYAFALDMYKRINGFEVSMNRVIYCNTSAPMRSTLQNIPVGSYLRVVTIYGNGHSLILAKKTDDEVWIYQCNIRNTCEVTLEKYTYAGFDQRFSQIEHYVPACSFSHTYTKTRHTGTCSLCGNVHTESHTYIPQANGRSRCRCGRWAETGGGIVRIEDEQEI